MNAKNLIFVFIQVRLVIGIGTMKTKERKDTGKRNQDILSKHYFIYLISLMLLLMPTGGNKVTRDGKAGDCGDGWE